jgi:hypothetical protein
VFEVKSGMLVLPKPEGSLIPDMVWEVAEDKEMQELGNLYGKTWHFLQEDRGDQFPLGMPTLMGSLTNNV